MVTLVPGKTGAVLHMAAHNRTWAHCSKLLTYTLQGSNGFLFETSQVNVMSKSLFYKLTWRPLFAYKWLSIIRCIKNGKPTMSGASHAQHLSRSIPSLATGVPGGVLGVGTVWPVPAWGRRVHYHAQPSDDHVTLGNAVTIPQFHQQVQNILLISRLLNVDDNYCLCFKNCILKASPSSTF